MDVAHHRGALADRGRAALRRARSDVARREDAGNAGREDVLGVRGGSGEDEAVVIAGHGVAEPVCARARAEEEEQERERQALAALERDRVEVRDRSEIGELHGAHGRLDGVTLKDGTLLPVKFLFMFLGAVPCTDWLADTIARDTNGFVLTGDAAGQRSILYTSVRGVFAGGVVRSGSVKRCATAVGEGAMVVRFVHERMTGVPA